MAMGGPSRSGDRDSTDKFYLTRVPLDRGGYDRRGSYWGTGAPLYEFQSESGGEYGYLRARDRKEAKALLRKDYPRAKIGR